MRKLYKKNELAFSLIMILIYITFSSLADQLSTVMGTAKIFTFPVHLIMSAVILLFLKKKSFFRNTVCANLQRPQKSSFIFCR